MSVHDDDYAGRWPDFRDPLSFDGPEPASVRQARQEREAARALEEKLDLLDDWVRQRALMAGPQVAIREQQQMFTFGIEPAHLMEPLKARRDARQKAAATNWQLLQTLGGGVTL